MDVAQMPQFFRSAEDICNSFCENQSAIDRAFNTVQSTWRDKNAVTTCDRLTDTARDISRIYTGIIEALEYVVRVSANRAEYIDYVGITQPNIAQFTVNIMEIHMSETVINTDPDALDEFKAALDKYIASIFDNVDRLSKLYSYIGNSWDDEQYVKLGDELSAFTNRMQTQVDVLYRISEFLKAKIEILRRGDV